MIVRAEMIQFIFKKNFITSFSLRYPYYIDIVNNWHWILDTIYHILDTWHWILDTSYHILDTWYKILKKRNKKQDIKYNILDTKFNILDTRNNILDTHKLLLNTRKLILDI